MATKRKEKLKLPRKGSPERTKVVMEHIRKRKAQGVGTARIFDEFCKADDADDVADDE